MQVFFKTDTSGVGLGPYIIIRGLNFIINEIIMAGMEYNLISRVMSLWRTFIALLEVVAGEGGAVKCIYGLH